MPITTFQQLRESGFSRRTLDTAVRAGSLLRIRRGLYASPDTGSDVLTALRCGGSLSCGAALQAHGIWVAESPLHVRVNPGRHVLGATPRVHRLDGRSEDRVDDVITALIVATACMPPEHAICALDSALERGKVTLSLARSELLGARGRRVVGLADGRSQSGIETLTRLRLRSLGIRLRVQVAVEGVGRVDILVGDRLVIELDGDAWHSTAEQRETDRRRDSALVALGYLVIRAGYWRVLTEWNGLEREVLAIVRRNEHLWRNIHPGRVHDDWRNMMSSL